MDATRAVRDFFERQLSVSVSAEVRRHLGVGADVSRDHLIQHLVERTIRRASVDAATQRALGPGDANDPSDANVPSDANDPSGANEVSWERCLMVAALAELRPLRLLERRRI